MTIILIRIKFFCRRFLRKPNVSEASDQFGKLLIPVLYKKKDVISNYSYIFPAKLAKKLKTTEEPQYEGMCHLAIARCEQSIGNANGEAEALISASRCYMQG